MDVTAIVERFKLLPLLSLSDAGTVGPLIESMELADLGVVEVALRSPCSLDVLREVAQSSHLIVGAGTMLYPADVERALEAGAQFLVSPGLSGPVLAECLQSGVPYLPGVSSPSELMVALHHGFSVLKFFPAELLGGEPMLKALVSVSRGARFVPTGGVDDESAARYLQNPNVAAVGGSWMFSADEIQRGAVDEMTERLIRALVLTK